MSTPMQIDSPMPTSTSNGANATVNGAVKSSGSHTVTGRVCDVISKFRTTKLWRREAAGAPTSILSLDFDDPGELLLTSESDESLQIYNVKEGKHSKQCVSKKYGVKLAKFSHASSCVIYASTKENDTLRYLSTHDNTFIRYFKGHEKAVTCIAPNPGADTFITCSEDDTVRLWDVNSDNCAGKLMLKNPYLAAFDPSASVVAIASEVAQTILLYDYRQIEKEPFATFDMLAHSSEMGQKPSLGWNKLEFSNDGKSLLVGTSGHGHYVLDAFDGSLRSFLTRQNGGPNRLAAGEHNPENVEGKARRQETSGDSMFSPDGRYVLGGQLAANVLVWDTLSQQEDKIIKPIHHFEFKGEAAVMAWNPRYNMFASGDKEVVFWVPDAYAD